MNPKVTLLDDDDYDLDDDLEPEYDFAALRERAKREGREYKGVLSGRLVRLAPDVSEVFTTPEAVNAALRRVINEMQQAA